MKIFTRVVIGLVALIVIGLVIVKIFVGAINVPLVSANIDQNSLAERIQVPSGFQFSVFADDVPNARVLRFTKNGDLVVSTPSNDQVLLLTHDQNGDGKYDSKKILLDKTVLDKMGIQAFKNPHGLDFYQDENQDDWLYVAESESIGRVKFDHNRGEIIGDYRRLITGLPSGGNHWKKTLRFGSDGFLYVAIGSSCNVCIEKDKRRASIVRYKPDGSGEEIIASGLRNSEGFDWNAEGQLYATDNGRDLLGDDFPPCEFNKIEQGKFYGWPFANGDKVKDPDYGKGYEAEIAASIAPAHNFRAHNAPLGMAFIRNALVPDEYKQSALVALHGSWNRSKKDGYKIVSLHWRVDGTIEEKDFVSGFLNNDEVIGRPADVTEGPDTAIYISDDFAGKIYRVAYRSGSGK